ncbi:MAG: hypothetical protein NWF07_12105 [Candidatus Bathyarchaeota archaeon]|nr:hypothetical protein [Candidatus Bathyarchaeota archaeon]
MSDTNIDTRYVETVETHPMIGFLVLGMMGFLVYLSITIPGGIPQRILAFIILMLGFIYANFMKMQITITSTSLTVGFGIIKHRINLNNIESIKVHRSPWYWYGGYGIRFGWDRSIGFIQNYRTGILVKPRAGWKLFFSTNHPEEVVAIIKDYTNLET